MKLLLITLLILPFTVVGQDALRLSVRQADQLLIERNLALIVSHYEIDKAAARRVQAGLFLNPELSTEWNLYNPDRGRFSDIGARGQKIIAVEQVFRIAGQRKAAVRLAEAQRGMTELQYFELVRSLKYELHSNYYRLFYLQQTIQTIGAQLDLLQEIVGLYNQQYQKGNISLKENTRLRAAYFQLSNEKSELEREVLVVQQNLKILLAEDRLIVAAPETEDPVIRGSALLLALPELQEKARHNRPEVQLATNLYLQNELLYKFERKNAVPNLSAGLLYDQAGSFVNNYSALTLGIQIPIFNRNQGAIQEARIGMLQATSMQQNVQQKLKAEVDAAFYNLQVLQNQLNQTGEGFGEQLAQLSDGLIENYMKKNISLLEFTDLFESYYSSIIEINKLKANLLNAYEELNYVVGETIL